MPSDLAAVLAKAHGQRYWFGHATADDLRMQGWSVAVHNDYCQDGARHTFWLLTRGDRFVKGEGLTDAIALDRARRAASEQEELACGQMLPPRAIPICDG
jgi:hypothetical protein